MGKIRLELGALQQLMVVHKNALKSKKVKAFKKDGTKVDVNEGLLKTAIGDLETASASLSLVCQQAVLAIEVEPDDEE
jgi:hypothetical protein